MLILLRWTILQLSVEEFDTWKLQNNSPRSTSFTNAKYGAKPQGYIKLCKIKQMEQLLRDLWTGSITVSVVFYSCSSLPKQERKRVATLTLEVARNSLSELIKVYIYYTLFIPYLYRICVNCNAKQAFIWNRLISKDRNVFIISCFYIWSDFSKKPPYFLICPHFNLLLMQTQHFHKIFHFFSSAVKLPSMKPTPSCTDVSH